MIDGQQHVLGQGQIGPYLLVLAVRTAGGYEQVVGVVSTGQKQANHCPVIIETGGVLGHRRAGQHQIGQGAEQRSSPHSGTAGLPKKLPSVHDVIFSVHFFD